MENLRVMSREPSGKTDNAKRYPAPSVLGELSAPGGGRQSDNPSGIAVPDFIGICLVLLILGGLRESWQELSGEATPYALEAVHSGELGPIPGTVLKVLKISSLAGFLKERLVYRERCAV